MKRIVVVIKDDGKIVVDYQGFQGDQCIYEDERLSKLLKKKGVNTETTYTELKDEYYGAQTQEQTGEQKTEF